MSDLMTVEGTVRKAIGKTPARKLRKTGMLPGNLNEKGKSTPIELNPKLLAKVCKTGAKTFNLNLDGSTKRVTISELQVHPIRREPIHVDLVFG